MSSSSRTSSIRTDLELADAQPCLTRPALAQRGLAAARSFEAKKVDVDVALVGFEIPNEFVVGYGLDYGERYRDLPFIGTLHPRVYTD